MNYKSRFLSVFSIFLATAATFGQSQVIENFAFLPLNDPAITNHTFEFDLQKWLTGDFNYDGILDVRDAQVITTLGIDLTVGVDSTNYPEYDLIDDGRVDLRDLNLLCQYISEYQSSQGPPTAILIRCFIAGDTNGDYKVTGSPPSGGIFTGPNSHSDSGVILRNLFSNGGGWMAGDFNGDQTVNGADFLEYNFHKGHGQ